MCIFIHKYIILPNFISQFPLAIRFGRPPTFPYKYVMKPSVDAEIFHVYKASLTDPYCISLTRPKILKFCLDKDEIKLFELSYQTLTFSSTNENENLGLSGFFLLQVTSESTFFLNLKSLSNTSS